MTDPSDPPAGVVLAISLFAALEQDCLSAGSPALMPYLGMARCALIPLGTPPPNWFVAVSYPTFTDGLRQLDTVLGELIEAAGNLTDTLRYYDCRELLREGTHYR